MTGDFIPDTPLTSSYYADNVPKVTVNYTTCKTMHTAPGNYCISLIDNVDTNMMS